MHFLTEEGIEQGRRVAASYHDTDAGVVHTDKGLMDHLTVVFEKVVDSWAAEANNRTDHVNEQRHYK